MDEKITVTAEFSKTDVAAALMFIGEELTPEIWARLKAAPSEIDFEKIAKGDRMQIKLGILCLLFGNMSN